MEVPGLYFHLRRGNRGILLTPLRQGSDIPYPGQHPLPCSQSQRWVSSLQVEFNFNLVSSMPILPFTLISIRLIPLSLSHLTGHL